LEVAVVSVKDATASRADGARPVAATAQDAVVALEGVAVVRDGRAILQDVDWTVRDGERWVVLGANGSGKTTLLQIVSTYLWPTRGTVHVLGERIGRVDVRRLRERIGYSSAPLQRMLDQRLPALSAVATGRHATLSRWREHYDETDWERARALLEQVGLGAFAEHRVEQLSEGERQRLHLARSLMARPALLLLDEPTAGLDVGAREGLVRRLTSVDLHDGLRAIVLVTHHVEEIPSAFTHVALLREGQLLRAGPITTTLTSESLSACFDLPLTLHCRGGRYAAWHA
jgi:iron complex transport system ATP-binding protein